MFDSSCLWLFLPFVFSCPLVFLALECLSDGDGDGDGDIDDDDGKDDDSGNDDDMCCCLFVGCCVFGWLCQISCRQRSVQTAVHTSVSTHISTHISTHMSIHMSTRIITYIHCSIIYFCLLRVHCAYFQCCSHYFINHFCFAAIIYYLHHEGSLRICIRLGMCRPPRLWAR